MGFSFKGIFYKSKNALTDNSKIISSMGFDGFVDNTINENDILILAEKYHFTKFLFIDYETFGGQILTYNTTIFYKGSKTIDNVRIRDGEYTYIPKYIILKIKNFGFSEYGEPSSCNSKIMSTYFQPFDRDFI